MQLEQRLMNAVKWSALGKLLSQLVNWSFTFLTIRILTPDDYGLFAVVMAITLLFILLNEFGLGSALVQTEKLNDEILKSANGVILAINLTIFIIIFSLSSPLSSFFGDSRLANILQVVALQFVLGAFLIVPKSILTRNIAFKRKELIQLIGSLVSAVSTYVLALNNFGVWSLVYGSLLSTTILVILFNLAAQKIYWPSFNIQPVKHLFSFGSNMLFQRMVWWLYTQADIIILKKLFSTSVVGIFFTAKNIASMPQDKLGAIINDLILTGFSKIKEDKDSVKKQTLRVMGLLSTIVFPIYYGIAAVSEQLIPILIGEQWLDSIYPLFLLCLIYPFRMLNTLLAEVVNATGNPSTTTKGSIINCIIMILAILIGSNFGLIGVCYGWILGYSIAFCIFSTLSSKHSHTTLIDIVKVIYPPVFSCITMIIIVDWLLEYWFTEISILNLISLIIAGCIWYISCCLVINRKAFYDIIKLISR